MAIEKEKTPANDCDLIKENEILTENERLILSLIRKGNAKSITIKFLDEKPSRVEVVCEKNIKIEARLYEIFQKNKFQELTVKTSDNNIRYATIKTNFKLT